MKISVFGSFFDIWYNLVSQMSFPNIWYNFGIPNVIFNIFEKKFVFGTFITLIFDAMQKVFYSKIEKK